MGDRRTDRSNAAGDSRCRGNPRENTPAWAEDIVELEQHGLELPWLEIWPALIGTVVQHRMEGHAVVESASAKHVHLAYPDGQTYCYAAPILHDYVVLPIELPASLKLWSMLDRVRQAVHWANEWPDWHVHWSVLDDEAEAVAALLTELAEQTSKLDAKLLSRMAALSVPWFEPYHYERVMARSSDPWLAIRGAAAWRRLGRPERALTALARSQSDYLARGVRADRSAKSARRTTNAAALMDLAMIEEARPYVAEALDLLPSRHAHLAAMRLCAMSDDEDGARTHEAAAVALGASPRDLAGPARPPKIRLPLWRPSS